MTGQITKTPLRLSLVVALGAFLLASHAEAVSLKHVDRYQPTRVAEQRIGFFLGEDGGIWYTVIDRGGLSGTVTTGNAMNPFDQNVVREEVAGCTSANLVDCNGFVDTSRFSAACVVTGDICDGIYARIPGPGTFIDTIMTDAGNPLCHTQLNLIGTGLDKNFWYTLFDIGGATANGIGGGSGGGLCPEMDPFTAAPEDKNLPFTAGGGSGFVNQPLLQSQCFALHRICVGPWVRFP